MIDDPFSGSLLECGENRGGERRCESTGVRVGCEQCISEISHRAFAGAHRCDTPAVTGPLHPAEFQRREQPGPRQRRLSGAGDSHQRQKAVGVQLFEDRFDVLAAPEEQYGLAAIERPKPDVGSVGRVAGPLGRSRSLRIPFPKESNELVHLIRIKLGVALHDVHVRS